MSISNNQEKSSKEAAVKLTKAIRDSLLIIAITGLILSLAELSLRALYPDKMEKKTPLSSLAYEHNDTYIVSLKPNIDKEFGMNGVDSEVTIHWKTNSFGFRGGEIGNSPRLRIIVYGDSNIQARFSRDRNTYTVKLQDILNTSHKNAEVINAGLVGAGPDQSLIRLSEDIDKINPDIVIFHIFSDNDYGDIIRNRLFEIDKDEKLVRTKHKITKDQEISSREPTISNWFNSLLLVRAMISLASNEVDIESLGEKERKLKTMDIYERLSNIEYNVYMKNRPRQMSHFADHYDIDIAIDPRSNSARTKIALMEKILLEAETLASARQVTFMVVVQPSVLDLTQNVTSLGYQDLEKYEGYKRDNLTKPLKSICNKYSLNCVHLVDVFLQNEPDSLYRKSDNHWSDKGQLISAEATAVKILELLGHL